MEETENLKCLDVDYIFDNFDYICEVGFRTKPAKLKGPSIIRNLSSTFDKVADSKLLSDKTHTEGTETDLTNKRAKSKSKSKAIKGSIEKGIAREGSKNHTLRKHLRLNLEDLFAVEPGAKPNHTVLESTRSKPLDYSTKANLMKFIRTKAVGINSSQLPKTGPRKNSVSKIVKKQGSSKIIQSAKDHLKNDNVFGMPRPMTGNQSAINQTTSYHHTTTEEPRMVPNLKKQVTSVAKQIKPSSSKQSFGATEGNPPTGSTRLQTTSRQGSANHRSRSLLDTDQKHQLLAQSCRNLHSKEEPQLAFPFQPPQQGLHHTMHSQSAAGGHQLHTETSEMLTNIQIFSTHNPQQPFTVSVTPHPGLPGTPDGHPHSQAKRRLVGAHSNRWNSQALLQPPQLSSSGMPSTPHGAQLGMFVPKRYKQPSEGGGLTRTLSGGQAKGKVKTKKTKRRTDGHSMAACDRGVTSLLGFHQESNLKKVSASLHLTNSIHQPPANPTKERSNSKGKYYIPAQLRFKSASRGVQNDSQKKVLNSFATLDDGTHHQSKSSYLYKIMFPKMISKGLSNLEQPPVKASTSAAKKKAAFAGSKDKQTSNIGAMIMNLSKSKKSGLCSTKVV